MRFRRKRELKSVGLLHGTGNVLVLLLFIGSWWLRHNNDAAYPGTVGYLLSFAGFALAGVTGWMGGELVDRLGSALMTERIPTRQVRYRIFLPGKIELPKNLSIDYEAAINGKTLLQKRFPATPAFKTAEFSRHLR